ncbi:hypothetical protein ACWCSH_27560 [Streptosporangium sp. NPDC001682]
MKKTSTPVVPAGQAPDGEPLLAVDDLHVEFWAGGSRTPGARGGTRRPRRDSGPLASS